MTIDDKVIQETQNNEEDAREADGVTLKGIIQAKCVMSFLLRSLRSISVDKEEHRADKSGK